MTDKKPEASELTTDLLMADALLRLTVLEKLLISKGFFTKEELSKVTESLVEQVTKVIMDKVQSSKDLGEFIESLASHKKDNN